MLSTFNAIYLALKMLGHQCRNPELSIDPDSAKSLERNIEQLRTDWKFMEMFYLYTDRWSNEKEVSVSLGHKIDDVAYGMATELSYASQHNYLSRKTLKMVNSISDHQSKTQILKAEIAEALERLPNISFELCGLNDNFGWTKVAPFVLLNLQSIKEINGADANVDRSLNKQVHALYKELGFIVQCIRYVDLAEWTSECNFPRDPAVDAFLNHVASVVARVVHQSCNYWFNNKADPTVVKGKLMGLVDLHREIDPSNPEFLELNLNFLKLAVPRSSSSNSSSIIYQFRLEDDFFRSFLTWKGDYEFRKDLMFLVTLVIRTELQDSREDMQSFLAEINAVLLETSSLLKENKIDHPKKCSELGIKICLLKVEHFLKEKFNDIIQNPYNATGIEEINLVLKQLRSFSDNLPSEKTEYGKQTLALVEDVANEAASLRQLFFANKIKTSEVNISSLLLLLKIVIFKAESFLKDLLKSNANLMLHDIDRVESLLEQLKVFNLILVTQLMKDSEDKEIFRRIEAFARKITFFSYSFLPNQITEEMIKKMILSFSELLENVMQIKANLKEISPQFPMSIFPKTYQLGFIDFLLTHLGELLKYDPESIAPVKPHIEEIQLQLKSFLMEVSQLVIENQGLKDLVNLIIDIAYKLDYVIDMIEVDAHWNHFFWFYDLLEELRLVNKQVCGIHLTTSDAKVQIVKNVTQVSLNLVSRDGTPAINEMAVDLSDEEQVIVDRLTRGSSRRDIVSIVGMPGIGKTTLAVKVYNNQNVTHHFHRRAWCTVSQLYEKGKLLLEILRDIHGLTDEIRQMSDADLELKLHQSLSRNKYLIVMDDVWDVGAWNELKNSLPDNANGSRILLTSRLRGVALEIKPGSDPHSLRRFTDKESWNLLEKKVFKDEVCPKELMEIGKEIAHHCQGLPLAVVAVAGLLKREEKSQNWWRKFAESLSSEIMNNPQTRCMEILELSYKHLPEHLKASFQYLGVFLEDKDIPVSKVIRSWIAEGLIKEMASKSLEDVAEGYLMDLIDRHLVMISKRRSNQRVKACCLHDLLRNMCRSKAEEDKLFRLVTRFDEPYASFPGSDVEVDYNHHIDPVTYEAYRLSISLKRNHFVNSRPSGPGTRSLIFFASADLDPRCPYDISFISHNFKFLWVLDLESINMGVSFPDELGILVQLRYLAVSGYFQSIPKSISNLWKLETFIVKGLHLRGKIVLPNTIWHMGRLRHLHVNSHVVFNLQDEEVGSCFQLENLLSFSSPALPYGEVTEKIIQRLPNVSKLRCIFLESWDSSENCNKFPRLNCLTHLESLQILYYGRALNSSEFILPLKLKNLTVSNFRLPWSHISAIGRLPNLEVLKLLSGAFEGQIWDMREEEFQELKFLKLDSLNIVEWNASCDHLPKLERLVLQNCKDLKEIPYDFADIATLDVIEVHWCGQSAEDSAQAIGDATGEIKVLISRA